MAIKYYVVQSDHPETLDDQVNEKLAEGWSLQGGVSVCALRVPQMGATVNPDIGDAHWYTYAQAMVKEE